MVFGILFCRYTVLSVLCFVGFRITCIEKRDTGMCYTTDSTLQLITGIYQYELRCIVFLLVKGEGGNGLAIFFDCIMNGSYCTHYSSSVFF